MEKRDKSLLDLENKIGNFNEKENVLKNMRINKPNMNMNQFNNNNKFSKENLLSFLDKFKKENEKIMKDENKMKYNIENEQQDEEDEESEEENINEGINLDEDKEDKKIKNKKKKGEKIEMDLLMGILEQQKKKEITIENIIKNIKNKEDDIQDKNKEKGEKEIIDFLKNKNL